MQATQRDVTLVYDPGSIDRHQTQEQHRMRREKRRPFQDFGERQIGVPNEVELALERLELPLHLIHPELLERRCTHDNAHGFGIGHDLKDILEDRHEVVANGHDDIVVGEIGAVHEPLLDHAQDRRRVRKESCAIALHETGGGRADADHEVGQRAVIERVEVVDKGCLGTRVVEASREQRVLLDVERPR